MHKDLIKQLRDAATINDALTVLLPHGDGNAVAKLLREAADAIEKLSAKYDMALTDLVKQTKPRWIPVTERLPEKRKWVLCWCVSNTQDVLRWENNEWYHDPQHVYFGDFVTHWMPLPEPPMKET